MPPWIESSQRFCIDRHKTEIDSLTTLLQEKTDHIAALVAQKDEVVAHLEQAKAEKDDLAIAAAGTERKLNKSIELLKLSEGSFSAIISNLIGSYLSTSSRKSKEGSSS
jgi:hypothetical protein